MESSLGRKILCATAAVGMLTACGGSGGGVLNAPSSLEAAQSRIGQEARTIAFSGEYVGRFRNSTSGGSRLRLILSQSQNALGGALISTKGSQGLAAAIAWVANGSTISGTATVSSASTYCTFSMSGKYKFRRLIGTYSATYGCSGQAGTFDLWHHCYFQGESSEAIRPESGVKPC